jgi:hypothetical protein
MTGGILNANLRPVETVRVFTPLGIRFWDLVLDVPIDAGLVVTARPRDGDYAPVQAFRTNSGVYAFQGLPGLRAIEYPAADPSAVASPPASSPPTPLPFIITVEDQLGRYLPELFSVDLPLPFRGIFPPPAPGSPPEAGGRAYLFSAPARPAPPGVAVVRADLQDHETGGPAAFAVLQVQASSTGIGIADQRGSVVVMFPFPVVERLRLGSPPGAGQGDVSGYTLPLTATVQYRPEALTYPLAGRQGVPDRWRSLPSVKSILDGQTPGTLWLTDAGPPSPSMDGNLRFGQELVLATASSSPPLTFSSLSISRGSSPP